MIDLIQGLAYRATTLITDWLDNKVADYLQKWLSEQESYLNESQIATSLNEKCVAISEDSSEVSENKLWTSSEYSPDMINMLLDYQLRWQEAGKSDIEILGRTMRWTAKYFLAVFYMSRDNLKFNRLKSRVNKWSKLKEPE